MKLFHSAVALIGLVAFASVANAENFCHRIATGDRLSQISKRLPFDIHSPLEAPRKIDPERAPGFDTAFRTLKDVLPPAKRVLLTKLTLETLKRTVVNSENNPQLLLTPETTHPFPNRYQLSLGKRLGLGMQGSVFVLNDMQSISATGLIQEPIELPRESVVKFPHRFKGQDSPLAGTEAAIREEGATYKLLVQFEGEKLPDLERKRNFPAETYWTPGKLPVIPVLGGMTFKEGTILVKPLIRGWNLKEIYQHYGHQPPPEMLASLKTLYELLRTLNSEWPALIQQGAARGLLTGERSTLDINPRNLMWIPQSEVQSLKQSGVPIEREGFFLIEFAFAATNMPQIDSWERFLAEFQNGLAQFH